MKALLIQIRRQLTMVKRVLMIQGRYRKRRSQ
jgi:hypothetical protein